MAADNSYATLQKKGVETLAKYFNLLKYSDDELLATEFSFMVPIPGTWDEELEEPHILAGSIDRLAVGHYRRNETLKVDDLKELRPPGDSHEVDDKELRPGGDSTWCWRNVR